MAFLPGPDGNAVNTTAPVSGDRSAATAAPRPPAKRVLITGAAGQVGYALCPLVAAGHLLGPGQPVMLVLLDTPRHAAALEGVAMELEDCALPLLEGIVTTTDADEACRGADVAVLCAGTSRRPGMTRDDVIRANAGIYTAMGRALDAHASSAVKVLMVANPPNTNALILKQNAPSIPAESITALTLLDETRAAAMLAKRARAPVASVERVIVWGNHSRTGQYPDVRYATVGGRPARDALAGHLEWLEGGLVADVQRRGDEILKMRGATGAFSAAMSACDHGRAWLLGTPPGAWTSMAVCCDGSYGVPEGLWFSFPVATERGGAWRVVPGLEVDGATRARLDAAVAELRAERDTALWALTAAAGAQA